MTIITITPGQWSAFSPINLTAIASSVYNADDGLPVNGRGDTAATIAKTNGGDFEELATMRPTSARSAVIGLPCPSATGPGDTAATAAGNQPTANGNETGQVLQLNRG